MLRVSALDLRFINMLKKSKCREGPISSSEMDEVEIMWLTYIQKRNFADGFDAISNRKSNNLQRQLHSGVSQTLSQIIYKYWLPHGRATVGAVIRHCTICRRHEGGPYKMPVMAPLPKSRVTSAVPFSRTGLDYLGPMYIKTVDGQWKVWVCLFSCMVTREILIRIQTIHFNQRFSK